MSDKAKPISKVKSVLFWSIISAAFIGPGTVTTASNAGASFGIALLWALTFATISTVFLQEAAARISISSGKSLGQNIADRYKGKSATYVKFSIVAAIFIGGAAYQAGNTLGAVSGISLIFDLNPKIVTLIIFFFCLALLWQGNIKTIAQALGVIVALMGVIFVIVAFGANFSLGEIAISAIIPSIPKSSDLLVVGLIGTTIVPYNLFLASGISKGQSLKEMKFGITLAVIIGGIISMAILIAGTMVIGVFSFESLHQTISENLGNWGGWLLGIGLFSAGFTSSLTAPMASAITAQSIYGVDNGWGNQSKKFRLVWGVILLTGLIFGLSDVKPIPVIILAQAMNGFLLPFVAILLLVISNDGKVLREVDLNSKSQNIVLLLVVGITSFLGLNNLIKALASATSISYQQQGIFIYLFATALVITVLVGRWIYQIRQHQ